MECQSDPGFTLVVTLVVAVGAWALISGLDHTSESGHRSATTSQQSSITPKMSPTPGECRIAEGVERAGMIREFGTDRGFRSNRCGPRNVVKIGDGRVLVAASYDTPLGHTPYLIILEGTRDVCESVDLSCAKDREVTAHIQHRLNQEIKAELVVDGLWGKATESALWAYGAKIGLTRSTADLNAVVLALVSGDVRPIN